MTNWFAGLEDLALPRRESHGATAKSVATPATLATENSGPQKSGTSRPPSAVASALGPLATLATDHGDVATVATAAEPLATDAQAGKSAEIRAFAELVASVATVASEFDEDPPQSASDGVPAEWVASVASLTISDCPASIPADKWQTLMRTADRFIESPWAGRLSALGWRTVDLFGADPFAPVERHDHKGLLWFLTGARLMAVTADTATIETPTGSRQTYFRHRNRVTDMVLLWELPAIDRSHCPIFPTEGSSE